MSQRLRQFAREMRAAPTDAKSRLWHRLRAGRVDGRKFRRQCPIGEFIVDFVCFERGLIVELDGGQHAERARQDKLRTRWLEAQGFRVLRFWNDDVLLREDDVLETILRALDTAPPLPNPFPRGERGFESGQAPAASETVFDVPARKCPRGDFLSPCGRGPGRGGAR